jgi:hypothetical protein
MFEQLHEEFFSSDFSRFDMFLVDKIQKLEKEIEDLNNKIPKSLYEPLYTERTLNLTNEEDIRVIENYMKVINL